MRSFTESHTQTKNTFTCESAVLKVVFHVLIFLNSSEQSAIHTQSKFVLTSLEQHNSTVPTALTSYLFPTNLSTWDAHTRILGANIYVPEHMYLSTLQSLKQN